MNEKYEISPIGYIHTGFSSKFGIPRAGSIVPELCGEITFVKPYSSPEYFRGLSQFSHIWVIWQFSECLDKKVTATVRPPRLGGNTRVGVFASRSPFRPNHLAMSVVALEKIEFSHDRGTVLYVKGADMLCGTPIIDIKPYIPFTDSKPYASGGFASENAEKSLEVEIPKEMLEKFPPEHKDELYGILSQDARPAYIDDPERIYSFEFYGYNIKFSVDGNLLTVLDISK